MNFTESHEEEIIGHRTLHIVPTTLGSTFLELAIVDKTFQGLLFFSKLQEFQWLVIFVFVVVILPLSLQNPDLLINHWYRYLTAECILLKIQHHKNVTISSHGSVFFSRVDTFLCLGISSFWLDISVVCVIFEDDVLGKTVSLFHPHFPLSPLLSSSFSMFLFL